MLISVCLLTGQFSYCSTALSLPLSFSTSSQSNMWSIVCSLLQEYVGLSLILYLNRYDLILPCPVTIVVKFGPRAVTSDAITEQSFH